MVVVLVHEEIIVLLYEDILAPCHFSRPHFAQYLVVDFGPIID